MARGRGQHRGGGLGLMPRIVRLLCVMAFLFASLPGTVPPVHAAMPMAGGSVVSTSVSQPCQHKATAFTPRTVPSSPLAAAGCGQGPFACSPCAAVAPGLLPPVATLLPSSMRVGRGFGFGVADKLLGQVIPPTAPPPRSLA